MTLSLLPAALGYLVDRFAGDPPFLRHPVAVIGTLAGRLEKSAFGLRLLRSAPAWWRPAGAIMAVGIVAGTFLAVWSALALAALVNPFLAAALEIWLISTTIASRGLAEASLSVAGALDAGDLPGGRRAVAGLVGRDTDRMDEAGAARAAVESAAENTVDAVVAPLFYAAFGGAPLAMAYRAVNTLDSMWGYRNERYLRFGWAAARLDDLAGYVPARLAGVLMAAAAALLGLDWRCGIRTWRRDARKHPSPNAGIPEAVTAGALRIRLGGEASYGGRQEFRLYLDGTAVQPFPVRGGDGSVPGGETPVEIDGEPSSQATAESPAEAPIESPADAPAEGPRVGPAHIRRAVSLEQWTGNLAALAALGGWIMLRLL